MPTYEYKCTACGHRFEQFQSMTAKPVTTCPACKKRKVERQIGTGAAVLFKGSGFYITDYRSDSYKKAKEAEKPAAATPAPAATPAAAPAAPAANAKPASSKSESAPAKSAASAKAKTKD